MYVLYVIFTFEISFSKSKYCISTGEGHYTESSSMVVISLTL